MGGQKVSQSAGESPLRNEMLTVYFVRVVCAGMGLTNDHITQQCAVK